jgi:hypothetical protein
MHRLAAVLICLSALASCAHDLPAWQADASWSGKCYSQMRSDALALAATGATDCGFASISGGASAARQVQGCVAASLKAKKPFIAGFQAIGTDSGYCESVATLPNGTWALLDVDYDRTGGVLIGNGPVLDVQECSTVTTSRANGQPFRYSACHPSDRLRRLLSH